MQIQYLTARAPGISKNGWYILRRGERIGPFRSETEARNRLTALEEEVTLNETEEWSASGLGGP